jgi:hypothetical protein
MQKIKSLWMLKKLLANLGIYIDGTTIREDQIYLIRLQKAIGIHNVKTK